MACNSRCWHAGSRNGREEMEEDQPEAMWWKDVANRRRLMKGIPMA